MPILSESFLLCPLLPPLASVCVWESEVMRYFGGHGGGEWDPRIYVWVPFLTHLIHYWTSVPAAGEFVTNPLGLWRTWRLCLQTQFHLGFCCHIPLSGMSFLSPHLGWSHYRHCGRCTSMPPGVGPAAGPLTLNSSPMKCSPERVCICHGLPRIG